MHLRALHRLPLLTHVATASTVAAVGDALAQLAAWTDVEGRVARLKEHDFRAAPSPFRGPMQAEAERAAEPALQHDVEIELGPLRTLRFAILIGGLVGGAGELWFRRALLPTFPGWTYDVALRTAFDQALFAPAVLTAVVGGTALLTRWGDVDYACHKLREDCYHGLGKMWSLWTSGAAANYLLVPTPWQPSFAAVLGVAWAFHVSRRVHLPTRRTDFSVSHTPERVGEYLKSEQRKASW